MKLLALTDAHFAWLVGDTPAPADAPSLPPGGLAEAALMPMLRGVATEVGGEAAWLMVVDGEAVGMISVKVRDEQGRWDIGYGVAPQRRERGHATAGVAALRARARSQGAHGLTAETLPGGGPSSKLLERNGFRCIGQFDHPEDGIVDQWVLEWAQ